jgi:hypothetical protein
MQILQVEMHEYFPIPESRKNRSGNSFVSEHALISDLTSKEQDSLTELSYDDSLKLVFTRKHVAKFWLHIHSGYPELYDKVVKYLVPSPTTYICETGLPELVTVKSKY